MQGKRKRRRVEAINPSDFPTVNAWLQKVADEKASKFYATKHTEMLLDPKIAKMVPLKLWPSIKEFTECAAAYRALFEHLEPSVFGDEKVTCYVIGDGHRPQAAAIIGAKSRWKVFSIDPKMRPGFATKLPKLLLRQQTAEDFSEIDFKASMSVLVAVHSHADLNAFWQRLPTNSKKVAVAIPCCFPQKIDNLDPIASYIDLAIAPKKKNGNAQNAKCLATCIRVAHELNIAGTQSTSLGFSFFFFLFSFFLFSFFSFLFSFSFPCNVSFR